MGITLAHFLHYWANFHSCKRPNMVKQLSHLVTLHTSKAKILVGLSHGCLLRKVISKGIIALRIIIPMLHANSSVDLITLFDLSSSGSGRRFSYEIFDSSPLSAFRISQVLVAGSQVITIARWGITFEIAATC